MEEAGKTSTTTYLVVGAVAVAAIYMLFLNKPAQAATNQPSQLPPGSLPIGVQPGGSAAEVQGQTIAPISSTAPGGKIVIAGVYLTGPSGSVQNGIPLGVWYRPDVDTWYGTILIQYSDGTFGNQFVPIVKGAGSTQPSAAAVQAVITQFGQGAIGLPKPG